MDRTLAGGGTDVYVKYHNDGSISIKGEAKELKWERIAEIELNSGVYEFLDLIPLTDEKIKNLYCSLQ